MIFCVLQIEWLAATDIPFNSSKTTCSISATSCWVFKLKGTPLIMDSLRFKAPDGICVTRVTLADETYRTN